MDKFPASFVLYQNNIAIPSRLYALAILMTLGIELSQAGLPIHWLHAPFLDAQSDPVYWLFLITQIPFLITNSWFANLCFTILLFALPILLFIFPKNKPIIFIQILLFTLFFLTRNLVHCHHGHSFFPLIIAPIPLLFSNHRQLIASNFIRYYTAFIFVSAALWKIFSGSAFNPDQFLSILQNQHASDILSNHYFYSNLLCLFNQFPFIPTLLYSLAILLQLSFILAFFTRNSDKILGTLLVIFLLSDLLLMGMSFYPMLIFLLCFWYKTPRPTNSST